MSCAEKTSAAAEREIRLTVSGLIFIQVFGCNISTAVAVLGDIVTSSRSPRRSENTTVCSKTELQSGHAESISRSHKYHRHFA